MASKKKKKSRVQKIRAKYGADIFRTWGSKSGGSPILKAWREGRITIHKR